LSSSAQADRPEHLRTSIAARGFARAVVEMAAVLE
jgi:hypothetical protein